VTTLRNHHVDVNGSSMHFEFIGKGGKHREVDIEDRRLARIVRRCQSLPGQELFQYVDDDGTPRRVRSQDVNEYLRSVTGSEFTAKDIRTWVATVLAYQRFAACADGAATKRRMLAVIDDVASVLGNTRAICRSSYIHPAVMDGWAHGAFRAPCPARARKHLDADEQRLLTLLRRERRRPRRERVMAPIASTARRPR
jgi:DNA topoisomerase I